MSSVKSLQKIIRIFCCFCICLILFGQPTKVSAVQKVQPLFERALQLSRDGDFQEAIKVWDQVLDLAPKDAAAWSNRGNVRLALGDPLGAIADQTTAIDIAPSEPDPHLNRGTAEELLHYWQEAENDYNWVLKKYPENPSALYNLGNVKGMQDNWSEAEALFNKASLAMPGFAMARSSKALAVYQLGELKQAETELRTLIRRYPMMADSRAALSALLWRKGAIGEAESNWAAAAGLDSRYKQRDWLLDVRRWPPEPTRDLMSFLALEHP